MTLQRRGQIPGHVAVGHALGDLALEPIQGEALWANLLDKALGPSSSHAPNTRKEEVLEELLLVGVVRVDAQREQAKLAGVAAFSVSIAESGADGMIVSGRAVAHVRRNDL